MKRFFSLFAILFSLLGAGVSAQAASLTVVSNNVLWGTVTQQAQQGGVLGSILGNLGLYVENGTAKITATPNPNYVFVNWTGATVFNPTDPNTTMLVSGSQTVTAHFAPKTNTLYATTSPLNAGLVNITPAGTPSGSGYSYSVEPPVPLVTVSVTPNAPYVFSGWSVTPGGAIPAGFSAMASSPSITFPMSDSYILTANFVSGGAATYTISIIDDPAPTVPNVQGGVVKLTGFTWPEVPPAVTPAQGHYAPGKTVRIVAIPAEGYQWAGFLGGNVTSPVTPAPGDALQNTPGAIVGEIFVNGDRSLYAHFEPIPRQVSIVASPAAAGSVAFAATPVPLSSTSTTTKVYIQGTSVRVTATPNIAYRLASWGTSDTANLPLSVTTLTPPSTSASTTDIGPIKASGNVTAYFEPIPIYHAVALAPGTGGTGKVDGTFTDPDTHATKTIALLSPGGSSTAGSPGVLDGTNVILTATPQPNWEFTRWVDGAVTSTSNPWTVKISGDHTFTPVFTQVYAALTILYDLTDAQAAGANVTVTGASPHGTATASGGFYAIGSTLTLSPVSPPSGWRFTGWSGALNGADLIQNLPFKGDTTVTAHFVRVYTLTTTTLPAGTGLIQVESAAPAETSVTAFDGNVTVNLTASAQAGSVFQSWSGGVSNVDGLTAEVLMNGNKSVTANFLPIDRVYLSTGPSGTATMRGLEGPATISVFANFSESKNGDYNHGSTLSLSATPISHWKFVGWDLNGDGIIGSGEPTTASATVTVSSGLAIKAIFQQITHTVTTGVSPAAAVAAGAKVTFDNGTLGNVATYNDGGTVTVTAVPVAGWPFLNWTISSPSTTTPTQGANPWSTTLDGITEDYAVTANFGPQYTLAVGVGLANEPAPATMTGGAPTITKGGTLPETSATSLSLTGQIQNDIMVKGAAIAPYVFEGWRLLDQNGNDVTGVIGTFSGIDMATGDGTLTMNSNAALGQTYKAAAYYSKRFVVKTLTSGVGTISPSTDTTVTYPGTVTLTASTVPTGGWFDASTNAQVPGSAGLKTIVYKPVADTTITAVFNGGYALTLKYSPANANTAGTVPAGVTLSPAMPAGGYAYNTSVTLSTASTNSWNFLNWTGNTNPTDPTASGALTGNITVHMTGARTITANYSQLVPLTFNVLPSDAGTLTVDAVAVASGSTLTRGLNVSSALVATSAVNYTFSNWTVSAGGAVTSNTVKADVVKTITANFKANYTVVSASTFTPMLASNPARIAGATSKAYSGSQAIAVTAVAPANAVFTGWTLEKNGSVSSDGSFANASSASTTLTINTITPGATYTARANFTQTYTITTGVDNASLGKVTPTGSTTGVLYGTAFTVTSTDLAGVAKTPAGWNFKVGSTVTSPSVSGNTYTFRITDNTTIIALYQSSYTLTVKFSPTNANTTPAGQTASVTVSSPGLLPTATAYTGLTYGQSMALKGIDSTQGWTFSSWTIVPPSPGTTTIVSGSSTTIVMNGDQEVTANFLPKFPLTLVRLPVAGGTVPAQATSYKTSGTTATITATLAANYGFKGWTWTGDGSAAPLSPANPSTTIVMDGAKTITANFAPTALITVNTASLNKPAGASDTVGGTAGVYDSVSQNTTATGTKFITSGGFTGEQATVTATANPGYDFVRWDSKVGSVVTTGISTSSSYSFTPTGATTLTAVFQRKTVTLSILLNPTGAGTAVATTNATITAPGAQSYSVYYGDTVNISATPSSVYTFANWTGATFANGNNAATTLVVNGDTTITANFTLIPGNVDIYLFPSPTPNHGTVSATAVSGPALSDGGFTTLNGTQQVRHYVGKIGQTVQISAAGSTYLGVNYGFSVWTGMAPNTGDVALLADRTNATTTFVSTPLTGNTDIRIQANFVPIVAGGGFTAYLTVKSSLDGVLLPTASRTTMPDLWTVNGSILDTGITPNRPWIRLYEVFVTAAHRYAITQTETLTATPPPALNSFAFDGWDVTYYDEHGLVVNVPQSPTTGTSINVPFNVPDLVSHNVLAVAKFKTVFVQLTVNKAVTGPDNAALTAQASLTSITPNGTLTSAAGAMPQISSWLRTSVAPTLTASLGGSTDYVFDGWDLNGDNTVDNIALVVPTDPATWGPLNADAAVTAHFTRLNTLTVATLAADGSGTGAISTTGLVNGVQAPAGPTSSKYRNGTAVSFVATPAAHNVVRGWKIETDLDDNGSLETVTNVAVADLNTAQTYALPTLLHSTKVTALFALENVPTVFTADPIAGGTITLDGTTTGALPYTKADAHYGNTSTLVAVPGANFIFDHWSIDVATGAANVASPGSASTTVFIDIPKTVTAHFVPKSVLTMVASPNTSATLTALTPVAGPHDYPTGTTVTVSVSTPDIHYLFDGWLINGVATGTASDTSLPITLAGDTTATATFKERRILTVAVSPVISGGSATANGAATTTSGQYLYPKAAPASVTAAPGSGTGVTTAGYIFDHWEVDGVTTAGANPLAIASLVNDTAVTAFYVPHPGFDVTLQANVAAGVQTLTATSGATTHNYISAPGAARFPWHAVVTANATAAPGYVFAYWTDGGGNIVSNSASYTLPQLDAAVGLTAVYLPSYRVDGVARTFPTTAPTGGTVLITSPVSGTSVTLQGSAQAVVLTATPAAGYVFARWKFETAAGVASAAGSFADATQATTTLTVTGQPGLVYNAVAIFNKILAITSRVSDPTQGSVSPAGVTNLPYGSPLTLTATGIGLHVPTGWYYQNAAQLAANTGTIINSPAPYAFTVTEDATITALFQGKYILTVQYDPAAASTGATPASVTLTPASVGNSYDYNTPVSLTAVNSLRWEFDSWSGPVSATADATTSTIMTQDQTVIAHFKPRYPLTLTTSPAASGTTNPAIVTYYTTGTTAAISVTPAAGYQFRYWTNDAGAPVATPTALSTTVVVDQIKTVTANMMKLWAITVYPPSVGQGATNPVAGLYYVTPTDPNSSPNGLFTVIAVPADAQGWEFDSWESTGNITFVNGTTRETATATILAAGDATMRPRFKLKRYDLTVTITPPGASSATTSPLGFLPSVSTATARYEYGTVATITLQPPFAGYAFNSWSGDIPTVPNLGDPLTVTILMDGPKHVIANFNQTRTLTILTDPSDGSGGTASGAGVYVLNQVVTVTTHHATGWRFRYWAGPVTVSSDDPTTVVMSDDRTILAAFELIPPSAMLTVVAAGGGAGSTVVLDASTPTAMAQANVELGSSHTVTANPDAGYVFDGWTSSLLPNGQPAITISSPVSSNTAVIFNGTGTLTANFKPKTVTVTLTYDISAGEVAVTLNGKTITPVSSTPGQYQYSFSPSDKPEMVATPKPVTSGPVNTFGSWATDGLGTPESNKITLAFAETDTTRSVSAFFSTTTASQWTVAVDAKPAGLGSAYPTASGTPTNEKYTLTAVNSNPYGYFVYWQDNIGNSNLIGTGSPVIEISRPTTGFSPDGSVKSDVTAKFQQKQSAVVVQWTGYYDPTSKDGGSIMANKQTINSNGEAVIANMGTNIPLLFKAAIGWKLAGYMIDGVNYSASSSPSIVLQNDTHTVIVNFVQNVTNLLNVTLVRTPGSQATVLSGSPQSGDQPTFISRQTATDQYMEVRVQLDPSPAMSENLVGIYDHLPGTEGANLRTDFEFLGRESNGNLTYLVYRVLVNTPSIDAWIKLGPSNPSLVVTVNPPDAGNGYIEALDSGGKPIPATPPVSTGMYSAGTKVQVRFVPATPDDVFLNWERLEGDVTFESANDANDASLYTFTLPGGEAVSRVQANVRQQKRTMVTRKFIDQSDGSVTGQSIDTGTRPVLLPDMKINDRQKKTAVHLISGREENPTILTMVAILAPADAGKTGGTVALASPSAAFAPVAIAPTTMAQTVIVVGSKHTVTATADTGYVFDHWDSTFLPSVNNQPPRPAIAIDPPTITSVPSSSTTTITINGEGTLTAYFRPGS